MTGKEDSRYPLRIARVLLAKAEQALAREEWREAALFARSAIENAAKAVLVTLSSVPRSHEPAEILECTLSFAEFPAALRGEASELSERVRPYGMAHQVLLS